MPTYEYACRECGHHLEVVQSFSDQPLTTCPNCGGPLRKVFGSIGIVLKGSGFYKTDSRAGSPETKAGAGSPDSSPGAASKEASPKEGSSKGAEPSGGQKAGTSEKKGDTGTSAGSSKAATGTA